jgi:hypothetical protein
VNARGCTSVGRGHTVVMFARLRSSCVRFGDGLEMLGGLSEAVGEDSLRPFHTTEPGGKTSFLGGVESNLEGTEGAGVGGVITAEFGREFWRSVPRSRPGGVTGVAVLPEGVRTTGAGVRFGGGFTMAVPVPGDNGADGRAGGAPLAVNSLRS